MRFSEFIKEASVGKRLKITELEINKAIDMLNTHCKDALWMLRSNEPIWRGDDTMEPKSGFSIVDPTETKRKSQNTTNFYTVILDNIPSMQEYPKRSRSLIASTDFSKSSSYSRKRKPLAVIPFDGVKIGVVNERDMWNVEVSLFDETKGIADWNCYLSSLLKGYSEWAAFKAYQKCLDDGDKLETRRFDAFRKTTGIQKADPKKFLDELNKGYGGAGFSSCTTKTLPREEHTEVWIGGKCMIIGYDMWLDIHDAYVRSTIKQDKK